MILGALPSGIGSLYEANMGLIENLIISKHSRYFKFPGETSADVSQQIRLICLEALTQFDDSRSRDNPKLLYSYLSKCVDNRLYNLYRGIYFDNNPPCNRCELFNKTLKICYVEASGCERIVNYHNRLSNRRQLIAPKSYSFVYDEHANTRTQTNDYEPSYEESHIWELDSSIIDILKKEPNSDELLYYYQELKNGNKIPLEKRKLLQFLLKELL